MENDVASRQRGKRDAPACIMRHHAFALPYEVGGGYVLKGGIGV